MTDRREFLKKLARTAAYSAPVIYTLSTPRELHAIVTSGMMWGASMAAPSQQGLSSQAPWDQSAPGQAPWNRSAPWAEQPGAPGGGGGG